jgi:hypothetical protein
MVWGGGLREGGLACGAVVRCRVGISRFLSPRRLSDRTPVSVLGVPRRRIPLRDPHRGHGVRLVPQLARLSRHSGPKPYKFIGFGDIHGPKPYKFTGFGDIHGPKPYKLIGFGDIHGPERQKHEFFELGVARSRGASHFGGVWGVVGVVVN